MIGQGNTAEIYAIEDDKILKLFREGISEKIAVYEYEKAVFVQIYIPNVPKVYECLRVNNRVGIIYERIQGTDMITLMIKSLMKTKDYSRKLARYHSEIHKNAVKMEVEFSLKNNLISEVNAVEYINDEQRKSIVDYIKELPEGQALCHLDFHPGNIIMQGDRPIIIDWMTACIGDPCADVARTYLMLTYGNLPYASWFAGKVVGLVQRYVRDIYFAEYRRLTGIQKQDVEKWILPVATARLREWIPDSERAALLALVAQKTRG